MAIRSIVYIDGFNFYYGAVRGTSHKWLDLRACFTRLRPDEHILRIHYFTALVIGQHRARQQAYLRALATTPAVNVILGKFKTKQISCRVRACTFNGTRTFETAEEKRTDVNIALQLLDDALHDRADRLIVVSGDSDLVPAIELVKARSPHVQITVYVPSRHPIRGAATEIRNAADKHKTFPMALLKVSQFPAEIPDGRGGVIRKPDNW